MSLKIAFIGAGSIGFTRCLLSDLLTVPEFRDIEVAFTDINPDNLRMVTQLCQRDIDENGLSIKIHSTLDRREAFKDAKYVINCVRTVSYTHLEGGHAVMVIGFAGVAPENIPPSVEALKKAWEPFQEELDALDSKILR